MILWVHLLAAIVWLGGMFFFLVVLSPVFHGTLPAREEIQIAYTASRRYQFVTARAMELLLLTGILNIVARGSAEGESFPHRFWTVLGLKVIGFGVMVGLQTWQRISMNRRLVPLIIAGGEGVLLEREWRTMQSRMATVTWLNLGIGAAVIFLGLMLGRL